MFRIQWIDAESGHYTNTDVGHPRPESEVLNALIEKKRNLFSPSYSMWVDKSAKQISSSRATAWLHGDDLNKNVLTEPWIWEKS